ncbi:MAG TPA: ABC transporter ATP-binding protein [Thermoanaerobaculia bacterium]|nr:ABC transporter ATP-binding protein [Thermoanaerobaculia bacterium]HUM30678.1 ABC transporter ATP-binding protein [Thermoanaerobaculia bacterium]HXK68914.1 ABC transporter ATP-binding protein [Thermoanaerobaculia bacterium]
MNTPALDAKNISVQFAGKTILSNVDFSLDSGKFAILTGESGMGKSTLLRLFLGFTLPAKGQISISGTEMNEHTVWELRKKIAFVPQEPEPGEGAVREVVLRPFLFQANREIYPDPQEVTDTLHLLGLPSSTLDERTSTLSGGERQRLVLAQALLLKRPILLLDEPISALDPQNQERVFSALSGLKERTILAVIHNSPPPTSTPIHHFALTSQGIQAIP